MGAQGAAAGIYLGHLVFERVVQGGQVIVRHHREHVVLDVEVHVPVDEGGDGVDIAGA